MDTLSLTKVKSLFCHSLKKLTRKIKKQMRIKHSLKRELYHEKAMDLYFKEGICGTHICKILPISRATKNHGRTSSIILSRKIY